MTAPARRALATAALLVLPACGHRGDPLPPLRKTPPALSEFRVAQRGDALEVSCRAPRASVDGLPLSRLSVRILWAEGTADLDKGGRKREVPVVPGGRLEESLPLPAPETLVRVAARAVAGGDRGPRTLILALVAQAPLEAPRGLTGRLEPGGVALDWTGRVPEPVAPPDLGPLLGPTARLPGASSPTPRRRGGTRLPRPSAPPAPEKPAPEERAPEERAPAPGSAEPPPEAAGAPPAGAAPPAGSGASSSAGEPVTEVKPPAVPHGFLVYRRVAPAPYGRPLAEVPTEQSRLIDTHPPLGQTACYVVRAVGSTDPLIESAASNEVCLAVQDIVAPAAPTGVAVLPREEGLEVVWTPSPETDLAGYRVYRQSGDGERAQVAEVPIGTTTWLDASAERGVLHRYTVTAVDRAGNESPPSAAAEGRRL